MLKGIDEMSEENKSHRVREKIFRKKKGHQ